MSEQFTFPFTFGDRSQTDLLGGKGANLAEIVRIGLPVPPGFTITTQACRIFLSTREIPSELYSQVETSLIDLATPLGREFSNPGKPLLVSVRSGAKSSMPCRMETVLNVGMTPSVAQSLGVQTGNAIFAWEPYRRFLDMCGRTVCKVPPAEFRKIKHRILTSLNIQSIQKLDVKGLRALADLY